MFIHNYVLELGEGTVGTHGDEPLDSSGKCQSFRGQAHSTLTHLEGLALCSVLK